MGYISKRPAIIANERRSFEIGLKIEKLDVVPRIGPMLLKQLKTALVTTRKSLLSRLIINISPLSNIENLAKLNHYLSFTSFYLPVFYYKIF